MKILIFTPHLSTGGLPQYLYWRIQRLIGLNHSIYLIEHNFAAPDYVVQRNRILNLLPKGNFLSLSGCKNKTEAIEKVLREFDPNVVHWEEIPEMFYDPELPKAIYKEGRKYFITETTHCSNFDLTTKIYLPDKFLFVSEWSARQYAEFKIPHTVLEYDPPKPDHPTKKEAMELLKLDPNMRHVLCVGLFTANKNQGELIAMARAFEKMPVQFHFVGNQAPNFESYWKPLMENLPPNCVIWKERDDVENFYAACDIMVFPSKLELNPLVVKEALAWGMPVLMYDLPTYCGKYVPSPKLAFLTQDINANCKMLFDALNFPRVNLPRIKLVHLLSQPDKEREIVSVAQLAPLVRYGFRYVQHINRPSKEMPSFKDYPALNDAEQGLNPGHYGCFMAFRRAIEEEFSDDLDFLMICECDCLLEVPEDQFVLKVAEMCELIYKNKIEYFSFGDKADLEVGYPQSLVVEKISGTDAAYITNKIIGLQCIIFPRSTKPYLLEQFKTRGWHGADIWFNTIFEGDKHRIGILDKRITKQANGMSLIDNVEKKLL